MAALSFHRKHRHRHRLPPEQHLPQFLQRNGTVCQRPARIPIQQNASPRLLGMRLQPRGQVDRLKLSAVTHRRSMNSEAIGCLEAVLLPATVTPPERLARARALRAALPQGKFRAREVDTLKREGRA